MMEQLQLISLGTDELKSLVREAVLEVISPKETKDDFERLTRHEVAHFLRCSLTSVDKLSKEGILQKYRLGGKVFFKRKEVENAQEKVKNNMFKR